MMPKIVSDEATIGVPPSRVVVMNSRLSLPNPKL